MVWLVIVGGFLFLFVLFAKLISKLSDNLRVVHLEFGKKDERNNFEIRMPNEIKPPAPKRRKQLKK
jgi:hypothetical protein